ncbi:MAG TPA: hypothetical protein ENF45_05730 [Bacteroidetes bacterium]|nr:hypothetical protein [Bacteroidota bacterium]
MERRALKFGTFITVLMFTLVAFVGCLNPFAPSLEQKLDLNQLIITEQKTPEEVLQNFRYAYVMRDSFLYSNLLDSAFVFVYFDPYAGTAGQFISWGRATDLMTTGRLFHQFTTIDLVWESTIREPTGEGTKILKGFKLTLNDNEEEIRISGDALFTFRKSPLDGKWRILKWEDRSNL